MTTWFFVTDLHGQQSKYSKLFQAVLDEEPSVVLLGGDLLPFGFAPCDAHTEADFIRSFLMPGFAALKEQMGRKYPRILLILGNDDLKAEEAAILQGEAHGLWTYLHMRSVQCGDFTVYGYACVPPTPFLHKDWEKYDVSRYVDPGCISPEEGWRTEPVSPNQICHTTIQSDLEDLTLEADLSRAVFLFHSPPYQTDLDRAALDGKFVENVALDVHVGSIAIRRFILKRQPQLTLHGHIHESARLTGSWRQQLGQTWAFSAAHDGIELALVRFDPHYPAAASRELL